MYLLRWFFGILYTIIIFGVNENKEIYAEHRHAYKIEINEVADMNNDGAIDLGDIQSLLQNKKMHWFI